LVSRKERGGKRTAKNSGRGKNVDGEGTVNDHDLRRLVSKRIQKEGGGKKRDARAGGRRGVQGKGENGRNGSHHHSLTVIGDECETLRIAQVTQGNRGPRQGEGRDKQVKRGFREVNLGSLRRWGEQPYTGGRQTNYGIKRTLGEWKGNCSR